MCEITRRRWIVVKGKEPHKKWDVGDVVSSRIKTPSNINIIKLDRRDKKETITKLMVIDYIIWSYRAKEIREEYFFLWYRCENLILI